MDSIEYIEEDRREEVAVFILDSSRNGEFSNEEIFELIRQSGITFDRDNIEITSSNENGVERVVVYRHVNVNVPYKVERTLIGDFPLDPNLSTDTQRDRAYALMHLAGLDIDDAKFEIVTKKDDMGRIVAYEVYQVQKTPLQEDKSIVVDSSNSQTISTIDDLRSALERLKDMRARLDSMESGLERSQAIRSLTEEVTSLEEKVSHPVSILHDSMLDRRLKDVDAGVDAIHDGLRSVIESVSHGDIAVEDHVDEPIPTKMADVLHRELDELDAQIQVMQADVDRLLSEYEETEARLQDIIDNSQSEDLLSEEEQEQAQEKLMSQKVAENSRSVEILRQIDAGQKRLQLLEGKRRIKQADLDKAESLDLTVEEYFEIHDAIGRKKIEEALMSQKGLADVFHKPVHERSEEEKEQLRQAKDEIFREIHQLREEQEISVFDAIELLYHLDVEFSKGENPRVLHVSKRDVDSMQDASNHSPSKVVQDNGERVVDYEPDAIPEDMKDVEPAGKREFQEKIALFRDVENGNIYIREYGLERFNLIPIGASVMINGVVCYPISQEAADRIVERQNNDYKPYIVVSRGVEPNQVKNIQSQEALDSIAYIKDLLDYTRNHNISIYRYYYDLANHYRHDESFVPEEFEQNNPFLKEGDYRNLMESNEERIEQYFASAMRRVIDFHLAAYREDEKKMEENNSLRVELRRGHYFDDDNDQYYAIFHYGDDKQKEKIYRLFEDKWIPDYGSNSSRIEDGLPFIAPYLADENGNKVTSDSEIVGGTSIPEDLLEDLMKELVEDNGATLQIGDKSMSGAFDSSAFHEMVDELSDEDRRQDFNGVVSSDDSERDKHLSIYRDVDNDDEKYVSEDNLNRLKLEPASGEVLIDGEPSYRISDDTVQKIRDDGMDVDFQDVHLGDRKQADGSYVNEKIVLYRDVDNNNEMYVNKYVLNRFQIDPTSEEIKYQDRYIFRIDDENVQYIFDNQENSYSSPYTVDIRDIHLGKRKDEEEENVKEIILYRDLDDNNQLYAAKEVLDYFELTVDGEATNIHDQDCYKIDSIIEMNIMEKASQSVDPKIVVLYENVHLKKKDKDKDDDEEEEEDIEYVRLFRDVKHNNQIYASFSILNRFGLVPEGDVEKILGLECYPVSPEQQEIINQIVAESTHPKIEIQYIDVELEDKKEDEDEDEDEDKKGEIHYQTVILKLTKGLDSLSTKGAKRYRASHISVSKAGEELRTGNWLYNVFGFVPGIVKMPFLALRKLAAKIMLDAKTKEDYQELQRRLYEDLTEEELEVLFRDYRGSNARSDNNPQINSFIADRMKSYVLDQVRELNGMITLNYSQLFTYLGEIRVLEGRLDGESLTEEQIAAIEAKRSELVERAAQLALNISDSRDKGIQLLSGGGFHGFEEDLKAVDSRMSYIGYRFAKTKGFDHETQELLARFGQGFNDAIASEDAEAILENFMDYEACYFDNTEFENSFFGKRSVGSKYYTPLVEEFNYRDDPFIRNLLSTIAIVSSVTSAVNAYRVHKVEGDQFLHQQQAEANRVNQANDAAIGQAQQVGKNIEGHRQEMIDGMEAQAHHATDEAALGIERHSLDANAGADGWTFGSSYTAMDQAGHDTYNAFYQDISSRLNDVAARYGAGSIDQAQALSEIAQVSNDAQSTLTGILNDCYSALTAYAQTHPDFDVTAIVESMDYILKHPDAIANMNSGIVDIMGQAGTLSSLSSTHMTVLSALPSDMLTTLIAAASASTLALRVSSTMDAKYGSKAHYHNDVVDMMEDYLMEEYEGEPIEEEHHHRR